MARQLARQLAIDELESRLRDTFVEPDDEVRLDRIQSVLVQNESVQLSVYPGESTPPEYHVYVRDPQSDEELSGCVLAPPPVVAELVAAAPHLVFETASFQACPEDTSPAGLLTGIKRWMARVWPDIDVPRIDLRPWPVHEVHSGLPPAPNVRAGVVPKGAPSELPQTDFPTAEDLSA